MSWRAAPEIQHALSALPKEPLRREFLYLIGASVNKLAVAKQILPAWKESWPRILVVGDTEIVKQLEGLVVAKTLQFVVLFLPNPIVFRRK